MRKVTWRMIFTEFKEKYPTLRKRVWHWCPYGYLTIVLHLDNGDRITYDYLNKKIDFLPEGWKKKD